ncbi:hypothetical protein [Stetteria hydrogenophila]
MKEGIEARVASREEIVEWLKSRIEELESELRILKSMLSLIEDRGGARPGERVEEIRVGRRRIARLYRGEDYVRLVPEFPMTLSGDVRSYLDSVIAEIAEAQARQGIPEEERVRLDVKESPDGLAVEARIHGLKSTLDTLKARAALKFAAEMAWEVYRAQRRSRTPADLVDEV